MATPSILAQLPTYTREADHFYPLELASRLVQMFSFTGDTVLDPFCGTATTKVAALEHGRNSIGVELDTAYCKMVASRLMNENSSLFGQARFQIELQPHAAVEAVATLAETPPPYRTRTQKNLRRKRRSSGNGED